MFSKLISPSLSSLTDGVARGSHSRPCPIRRWVERLLNFGPDDPAKAPQHCHRSHATCQAQASPAGRGTLPSTALSLLTCPCLPTLTHCFPPVWSAIHLAQLWAGVVCTLWCPERHTELQLKFGQQGLGHNQVENCLFCF